jgi:3-oxoacyl-[acyl-carrier-protein] synthase II
MLARDGIVVTGMGVWAAGAQSPDELYRAALAGRSPAVWVHPAGAQPVGGCPADDPAPALPERQRAVRRLDRSAQMAFLAASQALAAARLDGAVDSGRVGAIVGTGRGSLNRSIESFVQLESTGRIGPASSAESTPASIAGVIAQELGLWGPTAVVMATCVSAASAIAYGAMHLLAGDADAMLVGGAEAPIAPLMLAQLAAAGVTARGEDPRTLCRPFDEERSGLIVGEGAAFLVLERASDAAARGGPIFAQLSGWATGVDAGGRTGATELGDGLVRVVDRALRVAGADPASIGYINAHGTGTRLNDRVESAGLQRVFGDGGVPPTSSTKPITGHCLGATPALEAIIAIEALRNGCLPPTANHATRDAACAIDVIADEGRPAHATRVLSTSLGFWGLQAALVFERV